MAHFFLCHANEDTAIVNKLIERIQTDTMTNIWSTLSENLEDDAHYENTVERIESADKFILIWSESAAVSPEVMFEWTNALNSHQNLVICCLDSTKLPEALTIHKIIDFQQFELGYQALSQLLSARSAVKSSPIRPTKPAEADSAVKTASPESPEADLDGPIYVGTSTAPEKAKVTPPPEPTKPAPTAAGTASSWERDLRQREPLKKVAVAGYRMEVIIPGIILFILISLVLILIFKRSKSKTGFRTTPLVITEVDVQNMIKNYDFYALDWNDNAAGYENEFVIKDARGEKIIVDKKSGLTWQQAGSPQGIAASQTTQYIQKLNREQFAGYDDWRIPTLEEAMTLMEPYTNLQELHLDPIFKGLWCIWTADVNQQGHRWMVNFYTRPQTDLGDKAYVRACRK